MWPMSGDKTVNKNLWKNLYFLNFKNWKNKNRILEKKSYFTLTIYNQ